MIRMNRYCYEDDQCFRNVRKFDCTKYFAYKKLVCKPGFSKEVGISKKPSFVFKIIIQNIDFIKQLNCRLGMCSKIFIFGSPLLSFIISSYVMSFGASCLSSFKCVFIPSFNQFFCFNISMRKAPPPSHCPK